MPDENPRQNDQRILDKLDEHGKVLTRVETKMETLIGNGGTKGRIPDLERDVKEHSAEINTYKGSVKTIVWMIGGLGALVLVFVSALLAHIWGGK